MTMAAKPLPMNPAYLTMVRGTRALHQLLAAGKEDSPEADAIRDMTDAPWEALSEIERNRIRSLSEDLYSLVEPAPAPQPMTSEAQSKLLEAFEARQRGEWDKALDLLRRWRAYIDPALVNYLRGSTWLEAGDPETAALFYGHAHQLEPANGNYLAMALYALNLADPAAATKQAEAIVNEHEKHPPSAVARAADILLMSARTKSETEANQLFQRLGPILNTTLARIEAARPSEVDRSTYVTVLALLGFGSEFLGRTQLAVEYYSRALEVDPLNDALLVARGSILYGTSGRAIVDLELAIQHGSTLVWPYVFLAHHRLVSGRFDECRKLCEQALRLGASATVMSEVSEWLAIAQAQLGFPADLVRIAFDNALRLDPSNERARRNMAAFNASTRPPTQNTWETRTATSVRTSGLTERRLAVAA